MELDLKGARPRRGLSAVALATAALLVFQAGKIWLASHRIDSNSLETMERGAALMPDNADAWDRLGRFRQWNYVAPDASAAIADYQKAVQNAPLSAHYWMDLASAYEAGGDNRNAEGAFEHARAVYPLSGEVAWYHGNFLLRQQDYAGAYEKIQEAVVADPSLLPLAISRTWRSSEDVDQLLDRVLPATEDAYFQALDFFASIQKAQPGMAVWRRLVALGKPFPLARTFPFFDELIREGRAEDARSLWSQALGGAGLPHAEAADHSLISDGSFSSDFTDGGLGWRWDSPPGVSIDFDAAPSTGGARSLRLDFDGGTNLSLDQPAQVVPVQPERTFHFHASLRTEGITTESGIRFSITDPNHPGAVNQITESFTGTHPWTAVNADVTTGPETDFVLVRLVRNPSRLFDNRLSGTAWIADISLVGSDPGARQPPP